MPQRAAAEKGCQQILWLYGDEHYLTEVGTMNIFLSWHNEAGGKLQKKIEGTSHDFIFQNLLFFPHLLIFFHISGGVRVSLFS